MPTDLADIQTALRELGLTSYEAKAYAVLVQRNSATAVELARRAVIPRQRIYDVVDGLVQRGLVRPISGDVASFAATDPRVAIAGLIAEHRERFSRLARNADEASETLSGLWHSGQQEQAPLAFVEFLRDPASLGARFVDLQRRATKSMLLFTRRPYVVEDNTIGLEATRRIAEAGGDVRCCYEADILDSAESIQEIAQFDAAGERGRIVASVPMKLCLVDDSYALFSLTDPVAGGLTATNVLVEHPDLARSLSYAFEALWATGRPILDAAREAGHDI
ncbi:TrmB family transcriptional regulator [Flexivirga oryzae]|uniref:Putative DNA-binding transcriptional regulator n=1 Tax=Flexivirga oryzae TaxID=1794944 RepID=A0A839NDU7_9MICO|nr:TrmB family transcriptional regulator [Flexivirga oryzae]MBB2892861.1 putative DNA-binding transcriptional regulator [Flexivirga oryzae]